MHWPSKCPHALCTLEIGNPLSFLYHLGDVHGLNMNDEQQIRLTSASLDWIPEDRGQKRKAEDVAGRERLSKQAKDQSSHQPPDHQPSDVAVSPRALSKVAFTSHSDVADLHDVPELSRSEALSPSDSVDSCLVDDDFPFHEYLRSRSPSCSSMNGPSDREGTKGLSERKNS